MYNICVEVYGSKGLASFIGQQVFLQKWIWWSCRRQSLQAKNPLWLGNPGKTSPQVQNRWTSCPTKLTYVLQKLLKKRLILLTVTYQSSAKCYMWHCTRDCFQRRVHRLSSRNAYNWSSPAPWTFQCFPRKVTQSAAIPYYCENERMTWFPENHFG